jgi:hypothetical protein
MQSLIGALVESILAAPAEFIAVATGSVPQALLVLCGALVMTVAMGSLGYLALGAVVDAVMPDLSGQSPPQAGR